MILFTISPVLALEDDNANQMTLSEVIELVLNNNPSLKAMKSRADIQEGKIISVNALSNPSLFYSGGSADKTFQAGIQQTFETGFKRKNRKQLALREMDVLESDINSAVMDLTTQARKSYIRLYASNEKAKTINEILEINLKLKDLSQKRYLSGDISQLDLIQNDIISINAKTELKIAKLEIEEAYNDLNYLTGETLPLNTKFQAPDLSFRTELKPEELIEIAFKNRPELKGAASKIEVEEQRIKVIKLNNMPDAVIAIGSDFAKDDDRTKAGLYTSVSFNMPVLYRQQGEIKEATASLAKAEKEYLDTKNQISLEFKNAYARMVANSEIIKNYEDEILPKTADIINKSKRSFEEGKSGVTSLIIAQQSYVNTRYSYIKVLEDYQNALGDLERAIGVRL